MSGHWDAVGVGLILAGLFVIVLAVIDRGYSRTARAQRAAYRALRNRDRDAYWRLHHRYTALCSAGVTVEQAAAQAEQLTGGGPSPYLPVFTEGEVR